MNMEKDLCLGANYLNKHLMDITKDGVSIQIHQWGINSKYSEDVFQEHDYFKVTYILSGKGHYHEKHNMEEISKGTLILTPPEIAYKLSSRSNLEAIHIGFTLKATSHTYIQKLFDTVKPNQIYILSEKDRSAAVLLWMSLLKLAANDNTIYLKNNIESIGITLFWSILKDFEKEILDRNSKQIQTSASTLIYQAKVYIIENLAEPITIKDIADHLHISERHLSRLFNQELGQPFTTFIRKERIRKAGILLSDSNIPIKDIALQTGFSSIHYFTNVFSKEMDMPPGKFRERFRHQNLIT